MKRLLGVVGTALAIVVILGAVVLAYAMRAGISAREEPGAVETAIARRVRALAIPGEARGMANPVPASADAVVAGRAHFADHCASCHANDGSGSTEMGRGLYPKAPDMRLDATQQLTDGELFYIIENGIRFTGMPAWADGTEAGIDASWHLVHFIRQLPKLTEDDLIEMEALNPKPAAEVLQEAEEQRFLNGEDLAATTPPAALHAH